MVVICFHFFCFPFRFCSLVNLLECLKDPREIKILFTEVGYSEIFVYVETPNLIINLQQKYLLNLLN